MLGIIELLSPRGLDLNARIKLVRHQDKRYDVDQLEREGLIELYQSYQSKPIFDCDCIVSFIGLENSRARLHGVYRVRGKLPALQRPLPSDFKYPGFMPSEGYFYDLEPVPGFEDLKTRLVIDWGPSALAWHQWLNKDADKEVVEILPCGYVREFPGYLDFVISHTELVTIIKNPAANREWHRMLSAVAGVYLIVDGRTGKQYIGSASGEGGILSRWECYAATGHGGNKQLIDLISADDTYARDFSFTILRTLPRTLTRAEVIQYECLYKRKLGSRAFGLNSN
jgi:hypothetical protein